MDHYIAKKCHCGNWATHSFFNGEFKDNGSFLMVYYCNTHAKSREQLQNMYEKLAYKTELNEHGVPIMLEIEGAPSIKYFLNKGYAQPQTSLF